MGGSVDELPQSVQILLNNCEALSACLLNSETALDLASSAVACLLRPIAVEDSL